MNTLLSTSLLLTSTFLLTASDARAQATVFALPSGYIADSLSPDGTYVTIFGANGLELWNPATQTLIGGTTDTWGGEVSILGAVVSGRVTDPLTLNDGPGYWTSTGDTSFGFPPGFSEGCTLFSTVESMSHDGTVFYGVLSDPCNYFPFRWTSSGGYQIMDTSSPLLPAAQPSARVRAASGDGVLGTGWIQSSNRSGCIWDAAGVLSFPLLSVANPGGLGEIYGMDFDGDSFCGTDSVAGPFVMHAGVMSTPAVDIGLPSSGQGMLGLSADGRVAVGNAGGVPGPFGSPDSPVVWTAWGGGQDAAAFFGGFGVTLPTGNPIGGMTDISADGHTFIVNEAGLFGPGDGFLVQLPNSWADLGGESIGTGGVAPALEGLGYLTPGAPARLEITGGLGSSIAAFTVSGVDTPLPLYGGTVHTLPFALVVLAPTDASGTSTLDLPWPAIFTPGTTLFVQGGVVDPVAVGGVALTNAVSATGF